MVIHNVVRFDPEGKGYIEQEEHSKSYQMQFSRISELWVQSHANESEIES
jgi:hypothetical protein